MSKRCDTCGRGSKKSATRSHSNIRTLKRQNVNIQPKTIGGVRQMICAKCIKTSQKKKK